MLGHLVPSFRAFVQTLLQIEAVSILQRPPPACKRLELDFLPPTFVEVDYVTVGTHHVARPRLVDPLAMTIDANACTCPARIVFQCTMSCRPHRKRVQITINTFAVQHTTTGIERREACLPGASA